MKTIKSIVSLILIFISSFSFAQNSQTETSIIEAIQKDALFREKVFIQLNKTIYFTNEQCWFTAFVGQDNNNTPSLFTTNLKVNILSKDGIVLDSKTIFIDKGTGTGNFKIKEEYKSGKYYIQAFTNYMRNFGEDNMFIQEIEIVDQTTKIKKYQPTNTYDIQLFPESGHLLEDAENVIGIKALINGNGYPFNGKIINNSGKEIATFKGNPFGMSKCKFNYVKGEKYTAIIDINNTIQRINVPIAKQTGIIFNIDNTIKEQLKLTLITNKKTLPQLKNEELTILFYRNSFICDAARLTLNKNNYGTTHEFLFDKKKLLNGVNIVTLFKSKQPIAERKFYNYKIEEQTTTIVKEIKTLNDSIQFKIKTIDGNLKPIQTKISVSVLPKTSKTYVENQNIKTAFLLTPYVKGNIENPSYYFRNSYFKDQNALDLLLLNQGWTTYTLEEKTKEINPRKQFEFESGFTINGEIKKIPKGFDIGILSKGNRLADFSKFSKEKEFSFKNVFAYKNAPIKIALIKKNEGIVKPLKVSLIAPNTEIKNYSKLTAQLNYSKIKIEEKNISSEENLNVSNYKQTPKIENLDLIMLKNVITKKKKTFYDKESELASNRKVIAPSFYQNKKVTERMETTFQSVFDYFMSLGFVKPKAFGGYFISLRNAPVTLFGVSMNGDSTYPPSIILDGVNLSRYESTELIHELKDLSMSDIDEILINRSGAGGGINGTGGIIKIYRKKGNHKYFEEDSDKLYEELLLLTGFDRASSYYKPMYNIYSKESHNWSEISWENSLQTNAKGEILIKIPTNEFSNEFQFIINGFSNEGLLFNTTHKTTKISF